MTTHARSHKSRPVLVFAEGSQVRYGGEVVALGTAVRQVMRERGWMSVELSVAGVVATIVDVHGGGQVVLPLAGVRE